MSRSGERTSLLHHQDDFEIDRQFLNVFTTISAVVVLASVVAIVVLWIFKPPPLCNSNSTGTTYLTFIPELPDENFWIPTIGSLRFRFEILGSHEISTTYRLCQTRTNSSLNCKNYTPNSASSIEGTFDEFFTSDACAESVLSLEFLHFSPSPAVLLLCAADAVTFEEYCIEGTYDEDYTWSGNSLKQVRSHNEAIKFQIGNEADSIGYAGGFSEGGFYAMVSALDFSNTTKIGYCTQSWNSRVVTMNYQVYHCEDNGFASNSTCKQLSNGTNTANFLNGNFSAVASEKFLQSYRIDTEAPKGLYISAIGQRPYIDSICNLS